MNHNPLLCVLPPLTPDEWERRYLAPLEAPECGYALIPQGLSSLPEPQEGRSGELTGETWDENRSSNGVHASEGVDVTPSYARDAP